jgi:hypothetical protein
MDVLFLGFELRSVEYMVRHDVALIPLIADTQRLGRRRLTMMTILSIASQSGRGQWSHEVLLWLMKTKRKAG